MRDLDQSYKDTTQVIHSKGLEYSNDQLWYLLGVYSDEVPMRVELTDDQALVFFEWLSRLEESDAAPCEHEAERQVLWALHGQLEKALTEPFRPDYRSLVEKARSRISGGADS